MPKDVPVLLVHAATGAPLRFEAQHVYAPRGYGQEHEVSAAAATCHGRQRGLEHAARVRQPCTMCWHMNAAANGSCRGAMADCMYPLMTVHDAACCQSHSLRSVAPYLERDPPTQPCTTATITSQGDDVRTLPGRAVLDCNVWRFVCGSEVMELPAPPRSMLGTVNRQLSNTAQQVAARPGARRALERKLTRLSDNSGCIRESELALVFAQARAGGVG